MACTMCRPLSLLGLFLILTPLLCGCTGGGFSVELIHRDSPRSPFHDPSLTPRARVLAAVRRSYAGSGSPGPDGAVSEVISGTFQFFMYVNVGTPRTRMLALVDTGSDLVWLRCTNGSASPAPPAAAAGGTSSVFDISSSSTYGRVGCQSDSCHSVHGTSCDATSFCQYSYSYVGGSNSSGLVATETFTVDDAPGGCTGCRERPQLQVPRVNFGCATTANFPGYGIVGLSDGKSSLINQMSAATSLPRRFSYCLTPYLSDVSSALNFGSRATVTEPGAVTTPMVHSPVHVEAFYTVEIVALRIGSSIIKLPKRSPVIVDSGSLLTSLDKELLDPVVEAVTGSIKLPRKPPPSPNPEMFSVCYEADGMKALEKVFPDVTLELGGGALLTLKAENLFMDLLLRTVCLAVVPVTYEGSVPTIGSILQQNMHVGYDLDKRTITFAPADCATSYPSPPASSV
ncbi:aspartic proteinase CDR1-like [Triticum aestivum]|uniref:aspartic proteinase CDR1-like n=1 Tax=Triticum aestivum TaxID=4565 RepID=UPI001D033855|nr:aspartic proteinase CDR1-like [Triticum aestivum]